MTGKRSKPSLILICSLVSLALALYFGLTAHMVNAVGYGYSAHDQSITDWGKVALTLVFGSAGCLGLASILKKSD